MAKREKMRFRDVTYDIHAKCLELNEFKGYTGSGSEKKFQKTFENIMCDIAPKVVDKFGVDFFTFGINKNLFHFIINTYEDQKRISLIMQYVKSCFTEKFNKISNRIGPFWMGRSDYNVLYD